ncbi:MAG: carboxypeptidase regulatory-like domain-containing protein [Acidobacteriota bacterium]
MRLRRVPALLVLTFSLVASALADGAPRVVDRQGRPVSAAVLVAPDAVAPLAQADADGRLTLPEGVTEGRVEAPGYLPHVGPLGSAITLTRASRVGIRLVDRASKIPIAGARLELRPRAEEKTGSADAKKAEAELPAPLATGTTDERGRFSFEGLTSAAYDVHVSSPGHVAAVRGASPGLEAADELEISLRPAQDLTVRVVRGGKPVPGVKLRGVPAVPRFRFFGGADDASLELEGTTDDKGVHLFGELPARRRASLVFAAVAPDGSWGLTEVTPSLAPDGEVTPERTRDVTVELAGGTTLSGVVLGPDGAPEAGVPVVAELAMEHRRRRGRRMPLHIDLRPVFENLGGGPSAVTGGDGRFTLTDLPDGTWRVSAKPEGHSGSLPEDVVLVRGQEPPSELELLLPSGAEILGRVVDQAGEGIPDADVTLLQRPRAGRFGPPLSVTTDSKGRFELLGVSDQSPGRLLIEAEGYGAHDEPLPEDSYEELRIVLSRQGGLSGQVLSDVTGAPVTRFTVDLVEDEGAQRGFGRFTRRRADTQEFLDESGRFQVPSAEGRFAVRITATGHLRTLSKIVEVYPGQVSDLGAIQLPVGAKLVGRVQDLDTEEPVAGATVRVEIEPSAGRWRGSSRGTELTAVSDLDGEFELTELPPGDLPVTLSHADYPDRPGHSQRVSIEETGGEHSVVLKLEAGGSLVGTVVDVDGDPVPEAVVLAQLPGQRRPTTEVTTGEDGGFFIDRLPHGTVTLRRGDRVDEGQQFNVRKGETTEVTLREKGTRVRGRVFLGDEPVKSRVRLMSRGRGNPFADFKESYELEGMAAGTWTLSIDYLAPDRDGNPTEQNERVQLEIPEGLEEMEKDWTFEPPDHSDDVEVAGRVVDVDSDEGLEGWMVRLSSPDAQGTFARSDAEGRFEFVLPGDGTYQVSAWHAVSNSMYERPESLSFGVEDGQLVGEDTSLTLSARRLPERNVTVVDISGSPLAGARLNALEPQEDMSSDRGMRPRGGWALTDAFGRAEVVASAPIEADLLVAVPGRAVTVVTEVQFGEAEDLPIVLPRTGTIRVVGAADQDIQLHGLPGGWWVTVGAARNWYSLITVVGEDMLISGLPEGDYEVRLAASSEDVTVISGQTVLADLGLDG